MNTYCHLSIQALTLSLVLSHGLAVAQPTQLPQPPAVPTTLGSDNGSGQKRFPSRPTPETPSTSDLTVFDLDFKGGTPSELVEAIQKETKKSLNVIIPEDCLQDRLPAFKMRRVNVKDLFLALESATMRSTPFPGGIAMNPGYQSASIFKTFGNPSDDSIWYYLSPKPVSVPPPPPTCRFYQLSGYLDRLTVDDIITAVETGWKLMGDATPNPQLTFHKETKLLIAVGGKEKLNVIEEVLQQLKGFGRDKESSTTASPKR